MTDFLLSIVLFLAGHQAATGLLALVPPARRAGRSALLIPVAAGLVVALACMLPHLLGTLSGRTHSATDLDARTRGTPATWILVLISFLAIRLLGRVLVEARLSLAVRRRCRPTPVAPDVAARLDEVGRWLAGQDEVAGDLRVLVHEGAGFPGPFLRGVVRPTLYLHRDLVRRLDARQLLTIYLHEICHRGRGDHRFGLLYSLVLGPLNFSRRFREAYRGLRERAEMLCDDFAARHLADQRLVAETIVEVVRFAAAGRPRPLEGSPAFGADTGDQVLRRVRRLVSEDPVACEERAGGHGPVFAAAVSLVATASWLLPQAGLWFYCLAEHVSGVHCVP